MAKYVDESHGNSSFLRGSAHGVCGPGGDERIGKVHSADKNERSGVSGVAISGDETNDVTDAANCDRSCRSALAMDAATDTDLPEKWIALS